MGTTFDRRGKESAPLELCRDVVEPVELVTTLVDEEEDEEDDSGLSIGDVIEGEGDGRAQEFLDHSKSPRACS